MKKILMIVILVAMAVPAAGCPDGQDVSQECVNVSESLLDNVLLYLKTKTNTSDEEL